MSSPIRIASNTDPMGRAGAAHVLDNRNLDRFADQGDIETITKKINGGMNGSDDPVASFALALIVLGLKPTAIRELLASTGLIVDGHFGPKTRAASRAELLPLLGVSAAGSSPPFVADKPVVPVARESARRGRPPCQARPVAAHVADGTVHLRSVLAPASIVVLPWREQAIRFCRREEPEYPIRKSDS